LEDLIDKHELSQLTTLVNTQILGKKEKQRIELNYKGFENFLLQVAIFSHSRPPLDFRYYPTKKTLESFIGIITK